MNNMENIRLLITRWKNLTYGQGLDSFYAIKRDRGAYNKTIEVLKMQGLECKIMDGYSVNDIPIKNEERINIIFSDIFWECVEGFISPASYVATIVKACIDKGNQNTYEIAGIVGRGLRAFPSFLRELDLNYKFKNHFPQAEIINSPKQDVGEHTDIMIKCSDCNYRIWSYQNFERGLSNTASRLRGDRGNIPDGIHVLCPIDIGNEYEREEIEGWYFYSERYVRYLNEMMIIEKPDDYSLVSRLGDYAIKMYLKKANTIKK